MKKIKTTNLLYLLLFFIFASCLPQEKTAQCGDNEAFDSTKRKCVAALGTTGNTLNIASISPAQSYTVSSTDAVKVHNITVSDPYSSGYQVKWYLTYPNSSTLLLSTALSVTFNHTSFAAGSYIMEVQLFDVGGTKVVDNRSWTINIITDQTPDILAVTPTPLTTTTTSTTTAIAATGSNPDTINNVNYQWFVNSVAVAGQSGIFSGTSQALSFSFDPRSTSSYYVGAGVYNVQLQLTENGSGFVYDTYTWSVQNNIPNFASISLGTSGFGSVTPSTGPSQIITVIDELKISENGFLYGAALTSVDFCVKADEVDGVDGDGVFVDFKIDGANIAGATDIRLALDGASYCLSNFNDFSYNIPDIIAQESHSLTAIVYDKFDENSNRARYGNYTQLDTFSWTLRVRQKNTAPRIEIDTASTNITCSDTTSDTTHTGCSITQDTAFNLAITLEDDDYERTDFDKFRVDFSISGDRLDGSHSLSGSNCYHDFNVTLSINRYLCNLTIRSYDLFGPIDASTANYTVTAKVTDFDSPYLTPNQKDSNSVSWQITNVTASNTGITLNPFASDNADRNANPTKSFVSTKNITGTALDLDNVAGAASEGDEIVFQILVDDPERDSHKIKVERCEDVLCATVVLPALSSIVVNSSDNINPRQTSINHVIGQDEVIGAAIGDVFYRITVEDVPGGASDQEIITVRINNTNPDPVLDVPSAVPTQGTPLTAFTGFPLTINPGPITDASTADGDVITYQWMIDVGSGFTPIDGATERILVWTPGSQIDFANQSGTAVSIKLCVGDDGVDTGGISKTPMNVGLTDCKSPTLDSGNWAVQVYSNMVVGSAYDDDTVSNTSAGQIAVWVDPSSVDPLVKYMAYVNQNKEIIIEKHVISATGAKSGSTEQAAVELQYIQFSAVSDGTTPSDVTYLSMTGDTVDKALYVAYMAPVSGVDLVHIKRIDISGGKTGFIHDGKFGFDPQYGDSDLAISSLANNISVSANIDPTKFINADGNIELTFIDTQADLSVTFDDINNANSATITSCPGVVCSSTGQAALNFTNAINASTEKQLQGITATRSGSVVTIAGIVPGDYIEADVSASRIGQIMVTQNQAPNNRWILPIIDNAPAGANKNKVSMIRGATGVRLADSAAIKNALLATVPAKEIVNDIASSDRMMIATKSFDSGEISLFEIDVNGIGILDTKTDLFNDSDITNIKLKIGQTTANTSAYVTGKNDNSRLAFARIDATAGGDFIFSPVAQAIVDLDPGFPLISNFNNYDISGGRAANQLFVGVVDPLDNNAHILQVKGATPQINCNYDSSANTNYSKCTKIQTNTSDSVFDLPIAMSDVVENVQIGTDGAVASESEKDILFYGYHIDDGGSNPVTDAIPVAGIINIEGTTLTIDDSTPARIGNTYNFPYVAP